MKLKKKSTTNISKPRKTNKMKLNLILTINHYLNQINLKETNKLTSYWVSRNVRILKPTIESFEQFRKAAIEDDWFKNYQSKANENELDAREEYKIELDLLDGEFKTKLESEIDVEFYKISINDLEINPEYIEFLYDLIEG